MKRIKVKLFVPCEDEIWLKHTPDFSGSFGRCDFYINKDIDNADFWVIYDTFDGIKTCICPKSNVILITGEPEAVKPYHQKYIKQFGAIFSTQKSLEHNNKISKQLLPWFISKSYDELKKMDELPKTKLMSVVCSNKTFTSGHKKRLEFIYKLKEYFGDQFDIYGKGINEVDDKWDVICNYKYHIVLENSSDPDYWTEKLADSFLGLAYPIYWGCPNIYDYFNREAITFIDIENHDESITTIKRLIENNTYEKQIESLKQAKHLMLDKYNFFAQIADYCEENIDKSFTPVKVVLKSEWVYTKWEMLFKDFRKKPFKTIPSIFKELFN